MRRVRTREAAEVVEGAPHAARFVERTVEDLRRIAQVTGEVAVVSEVVEPDRRGTGRGALGEAEEAGAVPGGQVP